ncbi:hypothetical protein RHSIM_Rhsim07G0238700 [Rhododendron simsii]|uniref:Uncharacterized protein n=1 Tax=Rhododendron simsii TaxID=118357 RepID=A0A834GTG9_RHOSS|nr:hypothetical protein RHSIM_Rhsim07G0238700 [Rhododendron simsii]
MPTNTSFLEIRCKFNDIFVKQFCIKIWIDYYICLCRGAAVTTGLAYTQWFVGFAVVGVLITYFTDTWKEHNLPNAVAMINLLEGSSSVLVLARTYISDNHVSPLKVILCSTAAYISARNGDVMHFGIPSDSWRQDRDVLRTCSASDICGKSRRSVDEADTTSKISHASPEEAPAVSAGRRLKEQWKLLSIMIPMWTAFLVSDVPMEKYGLALNDAVIRFGSFLNAVLVDRLKSWFGNTLNCSSRLDNYYQMLMVLSYVNLCYYWFVSTLYWNKRETKDDVEGNQETVIEILVE